MTGIDRVATASLTQDQIDVLVSEGWQLNGINLERPATQSIDSSMSDVDMAALNGTSFIGNGVVAGIPDTYGDVYAPGSGGVTIAIGGDLAGSTVSVDGNSVAGSVTGNSASNSLKVSGTSVEDGSDHLLSYSTIDGLNTEANADHMLANLQVVEASDTSLTSHVYGTFAIDMNDGSSIAAATLTIDSNNQSSRSVANTADNSIALDAVNTAAGTALASTKPAEQMCSPHPLSTSTPRSRRAARG